MSFAIAFGFMNNSYASAQTTGSRVSDYFDLNGSGIQASFVEEGLSVDVQDFNKITFKNSLIINDMDVKVKIPTGFTTGFVFDIDSFYVNGNPEKWSERNTEQGTKYETTINNIVKLKYDDVDATKVDCVVNDKVLDDLSVVDGFVVLKIRIKDNYFTIGDYDIKSKYSNDEKLYYKVKNVDDRVVASNIVVDFFSIGVETSGQFVMQYVDQKSSDASGDYKQMLSLASGQTQLTLAKPRAYINDSFYVRQSDGSYKSIKTAYTQTAYSLTIKACSLLGGYSNIYLVNPKTQSNDLTYSSALIESSTTMPNEIRFINSGNNVKFAVGVNEDSGCKIFEEFVVDEVKTSNFEDADAPKYVYDEVAYASYLNKLKKSITIEKEDGTITSIGIGTDLEIPSFEDLVFDNYLPYDELGVKIYYRSGNVNENTTEKTFNLDDIGNYIFFVAFDDGENKMSESDFFVISDDETNKIESGIYGEDSSVSGWVNNFVFRFELKDDADIEVSAPEVQGKGYKGVEYKASKFNVDASGCSMTYELYYNSNINASEDDANWKLIPQASLISDMKYDENGYKYSEVKKVNYDGELTFVPTRIGAYKIVCTASSIVSSRYATDYTIIKVASEPKVVEIESQWVQNNIWSIVFLSIGSVCLVAIIILLCIKPKDKTNSK